MPKYVIVGGSIGGIGAIEAIREVDPVGTIALISEESSPHYSRPMIAEFLSGETALERMKYRDDRFWEKNRVQALTGRKAVRLDLKERSVELEGGTRIDFEKLLLATGGKPFVPKIEGSDKEGVFTFVTLSDAERLMTRIRDRGKAVVVGGGLIGVSVTEALAKRGVNVTLVEVKDRILNLILDESASEIIERAITEAGVTVVKGQTVRRIVGRPENDKIVGGVILTSDEQIPCDMVVIAIGVVPRTELVAGTDIKVNRGIIVDRTMCTSVPNVYACGDAAEVYDFLLGENRQLALLPIAHEGGRVAGYNMAGKKTIYSGGTAMSALSYFNTPIVSVGIVNTTNDNGCETLVHHDRAKNVYKKIVLRKNVIVGMILVNDIKSAGILFHLMRNQVDVDNFKKKLISEDFGLVSLPESLRKKMLRGSTYE